MKRFILLPISAALSLAILLLCIGVYIGWFNYLAYDDFLRATNDGNSLITNVKQWYFYHNGRFTNALIAAHHSLYNLSVYRFLHIAVIAFWLLALYFFYSNYLSLFIKNNIWGAVALTSVTFLVVTSGAPELSEWWFWYASSSVYMVGSGFFFLGIGFLLVGIRDNQIRPFLICAILLFLACGSHELLSMVSVCTAVIALLFIRNAKLFFPVSSSLLGMSLLVFSPGTSRRLLKVSGKKLEEHIDHTFFYYIDGVFNTLFKGMLYWTSNNLWWLTFLTVLSLFLFFPVLKNKKAILQGLLVSLVVSISILICSALLPVLLNWKVNINDPTRLTNLVYALFIIMVIIIAIHIAMIVREPLLTNKKVFKITPLLALSFLFVDVINQKNIVTVFDDMRLNKPVRQLESIAYWQQLIESDRSSSIISLPGLVPSHTLVVDRYKPTLDQHNFFNHMWARHLGANSNQKIIKKNFDRDLLNFIESKKLRAEGHYSLFTYKDSFRHYLLIDLYRPNITNDAFCVQLLSDEKYNIEINDESFKYLGFIWEDNKLCTDFVSKKVFCEIIEHNMVCRIPLPAKFNGTLKTEWGNIIQLHHVP